MLDCQKTSSEWLSEENFGFFMEFDRKKCSFEWAFKGSTAFSVISCEIREIARPAFAKTHLAGKLKGLGDVRNR